MELAEVTEATEEDDPIVIVAATGEAVIEETPAPTSKNTEAERDNTSKLILRRNKAHESALKFKLHQ